MGDLTRSELVTDICNGVGRNQTDTMSDNSTTYATQAIKWLNRAQIRMLRIIKEYEPFRIVDKTNYDITEDTYEVAIVGTLLPAATRVFMLNRIKIEDTTNSIWLEKKSPKEFEQFYPDLPSATSAKPSMWCRKGANVLFGAPSDATYDVWTEYYKEPALFTATSDVVSEFEGLDDVLTEAAKVEAFLDLQQKKEADAQWKVFRDKLKEADKIFNLHIDWEAYPDHANNLLSVTHLDYTYWQTNPLV